MGYNKDPVTTTRGALCINLYIGFRQLASDTNWGEEALVSQFYWGLRDDVKDLLLSLPDPQTLNKAISQAVKCDNRLFQRCQDQCPKYQVTRYNAAMSAKSLSSHLEAKDMQIDAARVRILTTEEKKRRMEEELCLYCEEGHKVGNCPKKQNRRIVKNRSAVISKNDDGTVRLDNPMPRQQSGSSLSAQSAHCFTITLSLGPCEPKNQLLVSFWV